MTLRVGFRADIAGTADSAPGGASPQQPAGSGSVAAFPDAGPGPAGRPESTATGAALPDLLTAGRHRDRVTDEGGGDGEAVEEEEGLYWEYSVAAYVDQAAYFVDTSVVGSCGCFDCFIVTKRQDCYKIVTLWSYLIDVSKSSILRTADLPRVLFHAGAVSYVCPSPLQSPVLVHEGRVSVSHPATDSVPAQLELTLAAGTQQQVDDWMTPPPGRHRAQGTHRTQVGSLGTHHTQVSSLGTHHTQVGSLGTHRTQLGSLGTHRAQVGSLGTHRTQVGSLGTHHTQVSSLGTHHTQVGSLGTHRTQLGSLGTHRAQVGSLGTHRTQVGSLGTHRAQVGSLGTHRTQVGSLGTHRTQVGSLGTHRAQVGSLGTHRTQVGSLGTHRTQMGSPGTHRAQVGSLGTHRTQMGSPGTHRTQVGSPGPRECD